MHALQRKTGDHRCALLALDPNAVPYAEDLQLLEELLSNQYETHFPVVEHIGPCYWAQQRAIAMRGWGSCVYMV